VIVGNITFVMIFTVFDPSPWMDKLQFLVLIFNIMNGLAGGPLLVGGLVSGPPWPFLKPGPHG